MLPGPTIIKRCAPCRGLFAEGTLASGNTFGAIFWTDGRRQAPMLPETPWLVGCPHCHHLLWIDEAEVVGEVDAFESQPPREEVLPYVSPTGSDLQAAISSGLAGDDDRKLLYLRIHLWWSANDRTRRATNPTPLSQVDPFKRFTSRRRPIRGPKRSCSSARRRPRRTWPPRSSSCERRTLSSSRPCGWATISPCAGGAPACAG
jgi:hypothetical protein